MKKELRTILAAAVLLVIALAQVSAKAQSQELVIKNNSPSKYRISVTITESDNGAILHDLKLVDTTVDYRFGLSYGYNRPVLTTQAAAAGLITTLCGVLKMKPAIQAKLSQTPYQSQVDFNNQDVLQVVLEDTHVVNMVSSQAAVYQLRAVSCLVTP